jgi:penicillin-binding protein 1A
MTLRRAFEQSRNVVSARIVEYLGPPKIIEYAKRFGITAELKPFMSIALGAFEISLEEMVGAFTVFPNLGVRVKPYLIRSISDLDNREIERNRPDRKRVIDPDTAYVVNYLMQGVVKHGTARRARNLNAPIGGKTGTTNGYTDAWFIGFSPSISVGVWVGFEATRSLGNEETGGKAASPVFVSFMEKYLEKYPEPSSFPKPPGVILLDVDRYTGKRLSPGCLYPFREAFLSGTEPEEFTREEDQMAILDYFGSSDDGDG